MILAFDTETDLTSPGCLAPRLVCISTAGDGTHPSLHNWRESLGVFRAILSDEFLLVGHNVAYDMAVLCAEDNSFTPLAFDAYRAGRVRCTMTRQMLIAIREGSMQDTGSKKKGAFQLGTLARDYLGVTLDKGADSWRLRYGELRDTPVAEWPQAARDYSTADAVSTLGVFGAQTKRASQWGLTEDVVSPDELHQTRAAWALHLAGCWGIRTDRTAVEELTRSLLVEAADARKSATRAGVFKTGGTRSAPKMVKDSKKIKALVESACARAGKPVPRTDPSTRFPMGQVGTSAEVLEDLDDPILHDLVRLAKAEKVLSTFMPWLQAGVSAPVNPSWNPLVATGRTSCREPNLQNQIRKGGVRECFVPREGNVFVNLDYATAELRSLAQVCLDKFGFSKFAEAFHAGRDPHWELGAVLHGVSYEEMMKLKKAGSEEAKEKRQFAKIANFGFPGGLGAPTLVSYAKNYGIMISEEKAYEIKDAFMSQWTEMRPYFQWISQLTADGGPGQLEQVRSGRVRGGATFCATANSFFQGLTADGAKEALWQLAYKMYCDTKSVLYGCRLVAFIHDEFLLEAPEERGAEAAAALKMVAIKSMAKWTPDIPVEVDVRLMRRWQKNAEAVYDETGKLVPWEPKEN